MSKKRRTFDVDSDDDDDVVVVRRTPRLKKRRQMIEDSDDENKENINFSRDDKKSTSSSASKKKKTPRSKKKSDTTPKSSKSKSKRKTKKAEPMDEDTIEEVKPSLQQQKTASKKKKTNTLTNYFMMTPKDFFSKASDTPNYKNLNKQVEKMKLCKDKTSPKKTSPRQKKTRKSPVKPKPSVDEDDDIEMMDAIPVSKSPKANTPKKSPRKPRKSPRKTPLKLSSTTATTVGSASKMSTTPASTNSPGSSKKTIGRKRKLDEVEGTKIEKPAKKARKWYPGFQRNDAPPMHGQKDIPVGKPYCLSGKRFVVTGLLPALTRDEAEDLIKQYGGRVTKAVSGMTRYLVVGEEPGESKLAKAKEKKVEIIDEDKLLELIRTLPAGKPPKAAAKRKTTKKPSALSSAARSRGAGRPTASSSSATPRVPPVSNGHVSGVGPGPARNGTLFVDKYHPRSSHELIGNGTNVKKLREYLMTWDKIKNTQSKGKTGPKRACLVSGPPGIGKTTAIHIVARECGYEVIEFNASDTRSKKSLKQRIEQSLDSRSLTEFFHSTKKPKSQRKVLVMDEVDGMSGGDRGGSQELTQFIKVSKTPIICICNDRQKPKIRTLAGYCHDLRFRRPTAQQVSNRLYAIAQDAGLNIDIPAIQKLAEGTHGDIRQMLHLIQFWSTNKETNGRKIGYVEIKNRMEGAQKDVTMGPWDVLPKLFFPNTSIPKALEYYFVDHGIMPLMIYENYLNVNNARMTQKQLDTMAEAAESISDADLVDARIRKTQYYTLLPTHGLLSSFKPAQMMSSTGRMGGRHRFPSWLGKNSNKRKNERLFTELATHMHEKISGGMYGVSMDYLDTLKTQMVRPLEREEQEGIPHVVEFMKEYGLSREDWDSITELGVTTQKNMVKTKVKTAFTRSCKHELSAYEEKKGVKGRAGLGDALVKVDAEGNPVDNEETPEEEEKDDNDISKLKLVRQKGGKKKRGAAKGKAKTRKTKKKTR